MSENLQQSLFESEQGLKPSLVYRGGFPCQPHSVAGKRKASSDERDLWPEFRRIISEIRPEWVVAENVPGLLSSESGRFFRGILRDFADLGFDVGWCTYSAASVGAIHRRERMAIVAHDCCSGAPDNGKESVCRKSDIQGVENVGGVEEWRERCNSFEPKLWRTGHGVHGALDRLKCLGNAVVPQQFYPVFNAIAECEKERQQ